MTNNIWNKNISVRQRQRKVLIYSPGKTMSEKYLKAAQTMRHISNNTNDKRTKHESMKDAMFFFKKYKQLKNK